MRVWGSDDESTPPGRFKSFKSLFGGQDPVGRERIAHVAEATANPFGETRLSREVRRLVSSLGNTRNDIAATLEHARVRATPHGDGPIARYLTAILGADPNVKSVVVDSDAVVVELRAWWRPVVSIPLPRVADEFTAAFEAGCYPALLARGYHVDHEEP